MPEGPSLVILKEAVQPFSGKKVTEVNGNTKSFDIGILKGKKVMEFATWGKHFLIRFNTFTVRIHFLLFGSYRINEKKDAAPRLHLKFSNGELNFYACSVKLIESDLNEVYDWSADVMNPAFSVAKARKKLLQQPDTYVCDALLNQDIFAGVGNIIKNEVLFRIRVHPLATVGSLPKAKITALIKEAVNYSFQFLEWKQAFELKKHWLAHKKSVCPRCNTPFIKKKIGKTNRRSFYCEKCQKLYND